MSFKSPTFSHAFEGRGQIDHRSLINRAGLLGTTAILAALLFTTGQAHADTFLWDNTSGNDDWSDPTNWTADSGFPDVDEDYVFLLDFGTIGDVGKTINLDVDTTIAELHFYEDYVLGSDVGATLTLRDFTNTPFVGTYSSGYGTNPFAASVGPAVIEDAIDLVFDLRNTGSTGEMGIIGAVDHDLVVNSDITLTSTFVTDGNATLWLLADSAADLTINGDLSEDGVTGYLTVLDFIGASGGTVTMTGANSLTGTLSIANDMTLAVTGGGTIATDDIVMSETATLRTDGGTFLNPDLVITFQGDNTLEFSGDETFSRIASILASDDSWVELSNGANLTMTMDDLAAPGSGTLVQGNRSDFSGDGSVTIQINESGKRYEFNGEIALDQGFNVFGGPVRINGDASATDFLVQSGAQLSSLTVNGQLGDLVVGSATSVNAGGDVVNAGSVGAVTLYSANTEYDAQSGSTSGATSAEGGAEILANGGSFASVTLNADPENTGGGVGTLTLLADTTVTGAVTSNGGLIRTSGGAPRALTAASLSSTGTIDATDGDLTIESTMGTTVLNTGTTLIGDITFLGDLSTYVDLTIDYAGVDVLSVVDGTTTLASGADIGGNTFVGLNGALNVADGASLGLVSTEGATTITGGSLTQLLVYNGVSTVSGGTISGLSSTTASGTVNLSGDAVFQANFVNGGLLTATGGQIQGLTTNNGNATLNISGTADLAAVVTSGAVGMTGGTVDSFAVNGGTTTVSAGTVTDASTVASGGTLNISGTADMAAVTTDGTVGMTGGTVDSFAVNGGTTSVSGGTVTGASTVGSGGTLNVSGTADMAAVTTEGTVGMTGGTVDSFAVDGGTTSVSGGTVTDASTVASGGTLNVSGTAGMAGVTSEGTVGISGGSVASLTVDGGTAMVSGGSVDGETTVSTGGTVVASGGSFGGNVTVNEDNVAGDGTFEVAADTVVDGDFTNNGTLMSSGASGVMLSLGDDPADSFTFTNTGTIDGDSTNGTASLTISAANIVLGDTSVITGTVFLDGGVVNTGNLDMIFDLAGNLTTNENGTTDIEDNIDGGGFDVSVGGDTAGDPDDIPGTLNIGDGLTFAGIGDIDNDGVINIGAGSTLAGETVTNDGTINIGANGTLQGTGNTINNNVVINVADGGTITDPGAINNNLGGQITFADSGTINADDDNTLGTDPSHYLTNAGTITTLDGGNSILTLGDGDNDYFVQTADGEMYIGSTDRVTGSDLTISNAGLIQLGFGATLEALAIENSNDIELLDGGTLTASAGILNAAAGEITLFGDATIDADSDGSNSALVSPTSDVFDNYGTLISANGASNTITLGDGADDIFTNRAGASLLVGETDRMTGLGVAMTSSGGISVLEDATLALKSLSTDATSTTSLYANASLQAEQIALSGTNAADGSEVVVVDTTPGETAETDGSLTLLTSFSAGNNVLLSATSDIVANGMLYLDGDTTINADSDNTNAGGTPTSFAFINNGLISTTSAGASTVTIGDGADDIFTNTTSGQVFIGEDDTLTGSGTAMTNAGYVQMSADSSLAMMLIVNDDLIQALDGITITATDGITNTLDGVIQLFGGATLDADTDDSGDGFVNYGGIFTVGGGTSQITIGNGVDDTFTNGVDGVLTIGETDEVTGVGLTLVNAYDAVSKGHIDLYEGAELTVEELQNGGNILMVDSTLADPTVLAADTITNQDGGYIQMGEFAEIRDLDSATELLNENGAEIRMSLGSKIYTSVLRSFGLIRNDGGTIAADAADAETTVYVMEGGELDSNDTDSRIVGDVYVDNTADTDQTAHAQLAGEVDGIIRTFGSGTVTIDNDLAGLDGIIHQSTGLFAITDANVFMDDADDLDGDDEYISNANDFLIDNSMITGADVTFDNLAGGALLVLTDSTLDGDAINGSGSQISMTDSSITGDVSNSGTLSFSGGNAIGGDLTSGAGSAISLSDGATVGETLNIGGNLSMGDGTVIALDADLATGTADTIAVTGSATQTGGVVTFAFDDSLTSGSYSDTGDIDVLTYSGLSDLDYQVTGLRSSGAVVYSVVNDAAAQAYQLQAGANPAIGALASGLTLTQSLINSVVNRPSSVHLTGVAYGSDDACHPGSWGRVTGGEADVTGTSTTGMGVFDSDLSANYRGVQLGFDRNCTDLNLAGWDLSYGATFGANFGNLSQPIYDFYYDVDQQANVYDKSSINGFNKQSFEQLYGGVYIGASKNGVFGDLQLRFEQTALDLTNTNVSGNPDASLGVADQSYNSKGLTLSGSLGKSFMLDEEMGLALAPSIGFSFSNQKVDNILFDQGTEDASDDGVLVTEDIESRIGFASLALTRTQVLDSGTEVLRYFGTATAYNDFGDDTVSKFYQATDGQGNPDLGTDPLVSVSENFGAYYEIGLGMNYTKLLNSGSALPARQLDASVRADGRFGENMDSWGLTAQLRVSF